MERGEFNEAELELQKRLGIICTKGMRTDQRLWILLAPLAIHGLLAWLKRTDTRWAG